MRKMILSSLLISFLASSFTANVNSQESSNTSEPNVLAEFKIEKRPDTIFLPVKFGGEECLFFFDTGSSHTVFDILLKHKLGSRKKRSWGFSPKDLMRFEVYDAPEAFLGPFNLQDYGEVICLDLEMFSRIEGRKVHGVL